ncbi:MAG: transcriptional regulator [Sulfobacillus thermosulfidooxidans]|nr:MAG: transcriptional regulator [Sulfobacillus thermosulfidooxidans]
MNIPAFTLSRQIQEIGPAVEEAMHEVVNSGQFILGPQVQAFEERIAQMTGTGYAVGVANGSDALYLALRAAGVGPGDEVITTPFTFFATAGSILRTGAKPVFTDINLDTFNMDPDQASARISPRTRAMLPVHLFGLMADIDALRQHYAGVIIEDAAQAIGATLRNKPAGSVGDLAAFSFFPTKNLGAFGDAGMVTTTNDQWATMLRSLRVHGSRQKYHHEWLGINSRLDAVQAAVLNVKLNYLAHWTTRRQEIAERYRQGFVERRVSDIHLPSVPQGFSHVFHQYTIRAEARDRLSAYLKDRGIGTTVYYPLSLHLQPALRDLGYQLGDFPRSEQAQDEVLSLPMFPELTDQEVDYVVQQIAAFYQGG